MTVTAAQVKELRERTGAGMMECKKALVETKGDITEAIELMRKSGQAKADKKAGRVAAEGIIYIQPDSNKQSAAMVEINCETDFVARDENFVAFVQRIGQIVLENQLKDTSTLNALTYNDEQTVEQARQTLIAKIGENIKIRRAQWVTSEDVLGYYLHGNRIGVIVVLKGGDDSLAKDLAMHIAANNPLVISPEDVPQEKIEKEKEIFKAQAENSGKPADIIEKMVEGRVRKFLDEVSLLGQPFVKDPNLKVSKLLQEKNAKVLQFLRFEVGEGIEKDTTNFAEEVMAQVKG